MTNQSPLNFLSAENDNASTPCPNLLAAHHLQALMEEVDRAWEVSTRKIEGRVEQVLLQCERFEWIADELRDEVFQSHSITAAATLNDANSRTSDIERALVSLALKATADSGILLNAYQPPQYPERLGLLHQIVKIEWENRYFAFKTDESNDFTLQPSA